MRNETVADGQQCVGFSSVGKAHALLGDANDDSADDVDEHDEQTCDSVATHELGGAVHRAEEAAFVFQRLAALFRGLLVDQASGQIGIDRHLLAGHGVQRKACCDFGDAAGAFGDDDEVHDHQNRKDDDADDEIAAHHEIAERLDDVTGSRRSLVAMRQDQPCRGKVERQPQHGGDQQDRWKSGEFQRRLNEQCRHQDQNRQRDRDRQKQIEHYRRQRQD